MLTLAEAFNVTTPPKRTFFPPDLPHNQAYFSNNVIPWQTYSELFGYVLVFVVLLIIFDRFRR